MEIERAKSGSATEWRIIGRLDGYWAGSLEAELAEAVRAGERNLRLNLSGTTFLSSAGIRILLMYWKELKNVGGALQVTEPSDIVNKVLEMSGLKGLMDSGEAPRESLGPAAPESMHLEVGRLTADVFKLPDAGPLTCRTVGSADLRNCVSSEALALTEDTCAVGIGAFGTAFEDCRDSFGELLAAVGTGVHLPTGKTGAPDYLIAEESYVPEAQMLSGLVFQGRFSRFLRLAPKGEAVPIPLSVIVEAAMQTVSSHSVGLTAIVETGGLVGASLKQSPVSGTADFGFPGIRDWIAYSQDAQHAGSLALVTGVACANPGERYSDFLRPMCPDGKIRCHFHAVAVPYRLLPGGVLGPTETVKALFDSGVVHGVLHLLRDDRPGAGAGESLFSHGVAWIGPVAPAIDTEPGKEADA